MRANGQWVISAAAACAVAAVFPALARAQYQAPDPLFAAPVGYYGTATSTDGPTLKGQLNSIIDGHTNSSYDAATTRLAVLDADPNNANNLILVYSGYSVTATWDAGTTWNREHLWPDSYGIEGSGTDYGDLFNLRPSDPGVNSDRGNQYYGDVPEAYRMQGHPNAPECYEDNRIPDTSQKPLQVWEPRPGEKGDIARAMFYMDTRYDGADTNTTDLTLTDDIAAVTSSGSNMGHLATLLRWHYQDGITNAERKRNDQIHDLYQNNRNPFVDRPELVWAVFGGGNNNSKLYVGASEPADGASATSVNLRVIRGAASWGSGSATLNKVGAHPTTLDISASGAAVTIAAGAGQTIDYDSATRAIPVTLNGPTGAVGTVTGTVTIDNTDITSGGAGMGAQDGNDTITVTGTVLEHAQPSFVAGSTATAQTIDFGYVPVHGFTRSASFPVHNNPDAGAGVAFTASLDVDGVTRLGDASFATDVAPSDPANPLAAGASRISIASFTPPLAAGAFSATHTIATSDENIPGATAAASLVLTTTGRATDGVFPVSGDLFLFGNETFNTTSFALGDDVTVRKTGPGAMNINGVQSHPTSTTAHFIAEGGGAVRFDTDANATATTGLMVTARSTPITFNSRQHLRTLALESSDITVTPASGANTVVLGQLVDDGQSQVNLNDNNLILRAAGGATVGDLGTDGNYTGVQGLVQRGYNFSAWDGDGLVTRTDDATVRSITTLAVATPADVFFIAPTDTMLWSGEAVAGDDVLVMYTYAGDLNFDGLVDGADYGAVDNWVQFPGTGGYINGDFNYDGVIDGADYGIIDNTVQLQGPPIGSGSGGAFATAAEMSAVTAVPEPAACGFALLAANFLARRRRTRV